jgi:predicted nucleic acid-binding protein
MAALVFDSGALIALERGDRVVGALLAEAARAGVEAVTSSACVAQVWRDPARQARLARGLAGFLECPLDASDARHGGSLMARTGTCDVVDAAIATLAKDGDTILTSDPRDIERLLAGTGTQVHVRPV